MQHFLLFPDLVSGKCATGNLVSYKFSSSIDTTGDQQFVDAIWSGASSGECQHQFSRVYRFELLPLGFVSRTAVGMFTSFCLTKDYYLWKCGLVFDVPLRDESTQAFDGFPSRFRKIKLRFDPMKKELLLTIKAEHTPKGAERLLAKAVEIVESTISGFYSYYADHIERFLVCSHCQSALSTSSGAAPSLFSLNEWTRVMLENPVEGTLICRSDNPIPVSLYSLAPDLALSDFTHIRDVTLISVLGQGAFGKVWKGTWKNNDVAIKELTAAESTHEEATQQFLAFQKEVAVMTQLTHPTLLRLYGIMLKPLRMVLGKFARLSCLTYTECRDSTGW
jgi:hypothetical protein